MRKNKPLGDCRLSPSFQPEFHFGYLCLAHPVGSRIPGPLSEGFLSFHSRNATAFRRGVFGTSATCSKEQPADQPPACKQPTPKQPTFLKAGAANKLQQQVCCGHVVFGLLAGPVKVVVKENFKADPQVGWRETLKAHIMRRISTRKGPLPTTFPWVGKHATSSSTAPFVGQTSI